MTTGKPWSGWRKRLATLVVLIPVLALCALWLAQCPRGRWEVVGGRLEEQRLLLQMTGYLPGGRGGDRSTWRRAALDLATGELLDDRISSSSPGRLERHPCEPDRPVPRLVDGEPALAGRLVCDDEFGRPLEPAPGHRLVAYQSLEGDDGKLAVARLDGDGRVVWRRHEREWLGERGRQAPGYRAGFAAMHGDRIVLALSQANGAKDVQVLMLEAGTGDRVWSRRLD